MALETQLRALDWKSNNELIINTAISGKRYKASFGHQYWSFKIQTPPLTREDYQNNFAVLFNNIDDTAVIDVKPGVLHDAKGRVSTTTSPAGAGLLETSSRSRGSSSIFIELLDYSTAGMHLTFGDFFQYTDHKKIYMINTNDASLDPDDWGGAPTTAGDYGIFPDLIKDVSTQNIKFNDLSVQVTALGETSEVKTDRDGYFVYEREVREVY